MLTIRDRILEYLKANPDGVDDTDLTRALGLKNHAQANQRCHQLEKMGLIERRHGPGNILNIYVGKQDLNPPAPASVPPPARELVENSERPWFWEGNVQSAVIQHLVLQGYRISSVADTASHQTGKDIVAAKNGRTLWVTVKGYPTGTEKTNASTQARHWFSHAVFDIVAWHGENPDADLALALPDYRTYRRLAERVRWLQPVARFAFLWVGKDGGVQQETSHSTV